MPTESLRSWLSPPARLLSVRVSVCPGSVPRPASRPSSCWTSALRDRASANLRARPHPQTRGPAWTGAQGPRVRVSVRMLLVTAVRRRGRVAAAVPGRGRQQRRGRAGPVAGASWPRRGRCRYRGRSVPQAGNTGASRPTRIWRRRNRSMTRVRGRMEPSLPGAPGAPFVLLSRPACAATPSACRCFGLRMLVCSPAGGGLRCSVGRVRWTNQARGDSWMP